MTRARATRTIVIAAVVLIASACDENAYVGADRDRVPGGAGRPSDVAIWGCDHAITELPKHLEPRWREGATVVGDFGFYGMAAGDFVGYLRHKRSDIEVKLPIIIEGHTGVAVWIPRDEQDRVSLTLADVPRRGPGNSYRLEDGYSGVRFEPCRDKEWTAWTAGLALVDREKILLMVKEDTASRATPVTLGPWEVQGGRG